MSVVEFGHFVLTIAILLVAVHGFGYLAERLKQPRIVGEILAGILLGPFVLKLVAPTAFAKIFSFSPSSATVMGFLYQLGLILLMFCSGAESRRLLAKENRRNTFLLLTVSDLASFALVLGLGFAGLIPLHLLTGTAGQSTSTLLIVAIATAVCSIPVISRIFWDLGIMRTRFVSLILGYALLEDLALWVVLAFATAIATSATLAQQHVASTVSAHVIGTLIFTLIGLFVAPGLLKRLSNANCNVLYKSVSCRLHHGRADDVLRRRGYLRGQPAIRRTASGIWHCRRSLREPARALLRTDRRHFQSFFWRLRSHLLWNHRLQARVRTAILFRDSAGFSRRFIADFGVFGRTGGMARWISRA